MPKIVIGQDEYEIPAGTAIAGACAKAGVAFNCNSGVCGSCVIRIIEGQNQLSGLTKEELDLRMDREHRLSCQCVIKSGTVRIAIP